jgi:1-deoxyxylulose-5-phosphate synthase
LELRQLGNTGIRVSALMLGTVELGMPYGFRGGMRYDPPDQASAIRLIHRALDLGINMLDTAPAYGNSEAIIGRALCGMRQRPLIATKVSIPETNGEPCLRQSIENSLRQLGCETLDLLQIHNATVEVLGREEVLRQIEDATASGKVRFAGASVYHVDEAQATLAHPSLRTLQVAFNLLDQGMSKQIFPQARAAGVGILARSVFLRGVLTDDPSDVPGKLEPLRHSAAKALAAAGDSVGGCAELALRFCLSVPDISSVLIGVRSIAELDANVEAAGRGPLDRETVKCLGACGIDDEALLSPLNWSGLI